MRKFARIEHVPSGVRKRSLDMLTRGEPLNNKFPVKISIPHKILVVEFMLVAALLSRLACYFLTKMRTYFFHPVLLLLRTYGFPLLLEDLLFWLQWHRSNNIVLTYNLPAPAWSCSWDLNNPHHVYTGLQNGMLTMFDLRQTMRPLECINGLSSHPVHTLHSLVHNGVQSSASSSTVLTASSVGPCLWNIGSARERPFLIPGMENQGVCTSLAYCDTSNDIIAAFRPKVNTSSDTVASQPSISPPSTISGPVTWGSHILLKQADDASYQCHGLVQSCVSAVRFQKSAFISEQGYSPLFTYGDETTNGLSVRDLPSLEFVDSLGQNSNPILDVKYAHSTTAGLLGCISEKKLQLFTCFEH